MRVVMGFDGSPAAASAIEAAALLLPGAHGWITYLWGPPFTGDQVGRRLRERIGNLDELVDAVEREGKFEAQRITATGVILATAAGWEAEPLLEKTYGAEGTAIVRAAEKVDADVVIVGARGLGGSEAVLGSVSDMVVHYCPRPILVVPHPLLSTEFDSLAAGPVVVAWDGSAGAEAALAAAGRIFGHRSIVAVSVDDDAEVPAPPTGGNVTHTHVRRTGVRRARGVAAAVVAAADDHDAAVVVVGSRGRSAVREILMGSVAMGTLHLSHRPVLVVPDPERNATATAR
jgi:nucleotide-binding universal stress UspA family protein